MKKLLSLVMALSMLLSVLFCVPVQANYYEGYPYLSLDFEKDDLAELRAGGYIGNILQKQWKVGGANGTNGCLALMDNKQWGNEYFYPKRPLVLGRTYRASVWVKVNLDDFHGKSAAMTFFIYTKSDKGNSAYKQVPLQGSLKPNEWVLCSTTFTWDGIVYDEGIKGQGMADPNQSIHIAARLGSSNSTLYMQLKALDEYANDASFAVSYDMDDFIFEPVSEEKEEGKYDDSYTVAMDFEDGKVGSLGGAGTKSVVDDPERGKVLQNVAKVNQFSEVTVNGSVEYNHTYKISAWIKRTDDLCVYKGGKSRVQMITWLHTRVDKENVTNGVSYPAYFTDRFMEQNVWYYVEIYQKFDVKTFDDYKPMIGFRVGNASACADVSAANGGEKIEEGEEGVTWMIDNFFVQDLGIITNADFESEKAPIWYYQRNDGSGKKIESNVFSWLESGAASAVSSDVRSTDDDAETTSTKSMEVTVAVDGGNVYQGIKIDQNIDYRISFWAKGANLADGEEVPISLVLDRKVDTVLPQDVYDVPDYERIGDNWMLTNQWQKFEVDFSPEYEAKGTVGANVLPRTPFLYFEVNGNKAGTKYFIDDLQMLDVRLLESETVYPYPKAELISVDAPDGFVDGAKIVLEYNFISEADKLEGNTVVRILASENGVDWGICDHVLADYGYATYQIPSSLVGKIIKAEILPIDETETEDTKIYEQGDILTVELGEVMKAFVIEHEITKWSEADGEVAAQVYFENNMASLGDQNVVAILAVYDENNTLIGLAEKAETVLVGTPATMKVSASLAGAENLVPTYAKLYVWEGTSLDDAGVKIFANAVSYLAE